MQGPEASSHAHEAGYDAYMTGAAFACLVRLYEAVGSKPGQTHSKASQQPSLEAVQHLMGRLNIGRYALLDSLLGNMTPGDWTETTSSAAELISRVLCRELAASERILSTSLVLSHIIYTCAFKPGCIMSHDCLHTPDCKV